MVRPTSLPAKALEALARKHGVSAKGTRRQVLRRIGRQINPEFDERSYLGMAPAPPSGSFLEDTFSESGGFGNLQTQHTGEKGATWVTSLGMTVGAPGRVWGNATGYRYAYASGLPAGADYSVEAGLFCASVVGSVRSAGPAARVSTSADTSYQLYWVTNTGFSLVKRVAITETVLGTYALVGTVGQEVKATISAVGTAIKGFVNGVERISATDSAITAAGRAGFRCHATEGASALVNYIVATDILTEVLADLTAKYAIRGAVSADLQGLYAIRKLASAELSALYALRGLVQSDLTALYGLRALVNADLTGVYALRALVDRELAVSYDLRGLVLAELGASYALRGQAQAELQGLYAIAQLIGADLVGLYAIREQVARELEATYDIRSQALAELVASYDIAGVTTAELVVLYSLLEPKRHATSLRLTTRPKTSLAMTTRPKTVLVMRMRPLK